jgi:SPP1 gp7 family putative phage head morphogenesis protein
MENKILSSESDTQYTHSPAKEKTTKLASLDPDSFISPWNPDDVVQKNQDYSLYEDMLKDDQVSVCLTLKKDLILCSGYDIVAQEDGQEEIVKDIEIAINEDPDWPFEQMMEEVLSACEFGFSISEKVFKKRDDGKISLRWLKTRHPGPWLIHQDDAGNIVRYEQQGTSTNLDVPEDVLIHFINKRRFQNPYGVSDLRAAYQAYFAKKHITRWYSIFIEKSASPVPHGKYGKEATPKAVTDMYNALKRFQTKTTLVTPDYMDVDFLETKSNGEAFVKGINIFNMFIGRALLIPDLLGFSGSETSGGSFSLGANQMEVFLKHIKRVRDNLEKTINQEVIWPIVLHNYGFVDNYPKLKFRPISKDELVEASKLWLEAVKSRVWEPTQEEISHFKNIINYPVTDEEQNNPQEIEEVEEPEVAIIPTDDGDEIEELEVEENSRKKKYRFGPTNGNFADKTNLNMIESQLNSSLESFLAISEPLIDAMMDDLITQIDRKKIVQAGKLEKAESLKLKKTAGLRQKLMKALKELYGKSKETASREILKSGFAKPIVDEAFLKILEEETFQFIGDWEFAVTKAARVAMVEAIKDGKPISAVAEIVEDKAKDAAQVSMDRYARTKFTEVMNKGRVAFFNESNVVSGYQYSAILDGRVTEICRGLHGKKFKAGTQPIPPMHFNCRSVLIPITKFEAFDPDTKIGKRGIDDFIEEKKGVGFPKQ